MQISHHVLDGLSQCVSRRSLMANCDIMHAMSNNVCIHTNDGSFEHITFVDQYLHYYILLPSFRPSCNALVLDSLEYMISVTVNDYNWPYIKQTVDQFHCQVCVHASISERNILISWNVFCIGGLKNIATGLSTSSLPVANSYYTSRTETSL